MDSVYTKELTVSPDLCNPFAQLSYPAVFTLFQNISAEHAEKLGIGIAAMKEKDAFWLTVHTRIDFLHPAFVMDSISVSTWPIPCRPVDYRSFRNYRVKKADVTIAEGKTEWAIINSNLRLLPFQHSGFPDDFPFSDLRVIEEPLLRLKDDFTEEDFCFSHIVRLSDLDFGHHMNNVAYVKIALDIFSEKELSAFPISSIEIHYSSSCYEGECLSICKKQTPEGYRIAIKKENGHAAALLNITRA